MTEEWKEVPDCCDGLVWASNLGRIKILARVVYAINRWGKLSGRRYKETVTIGNGWKNYKRIKLVDRTHHTVHRLICRAFLPNPHGHASINHKDGNKRNNRLSNLEWCSHSDNQKHSYEILNHPTPWQKGVIQKDTNGQPIKVWKSITEAARHLKVGHSTISNAVRGTAKIAAGFKWEYAEQTKYRRKER